MSIRVALAVAVLGLSVSCATNHAAKFTLPTPAPDLAMAEIERCLSDLRMDEVSSVWPYSEYIEEFPEQVVAIWQTPPIEYKSKLHQAFEIPPPQDYGTAWVRPGEGTYFVTFHKHDHSLPERFRTCISQSEHDIEVEVESYRTLDLS